MKNIYLYNEITDSFMASFGFGVSAEMLRTAFSQVDPSEDILLHINSPGGYATEGLAMRDIILERGNVTTRVEGIAASAATLPLVAGKQVQATDTSRLFIHQASVSAYGADHDELLMIADGLSKVTESVAHVYNDKSGKPIDHFLDLMNPGKYYSAKEARKEGLVDEVVKVKPESTKVGNVANSAKNGAESYQNEWYSEILNRIGYKIGSEPAQNRGTIIQSPFTGSLIRVVGHEANLAAMFDKTLASRFFGPVEPHRNNASGAASNPAGTQAVVPPVETTKTPADAAHIDRMKRTMEGLFGK